MFHDPTMLVDSFFLDVVGSIPQNHRKEWVSGASMGEIYYNGWGVRAKAHLIVFFCTNNSVFEVH